MQDFIWLAIDTRAIPAIRLSGSPAFGTRADCQNYIDATHGATPRDFWTIAKRCERRGR